MKLRTAKLIGHHVDGIEVVKPEVPLGQTYIVDVDSKKISTWLHTESGHTADKEVINMVDVDGRSLAWFFAELLEISE